METCIWCGSSPASSLEHILPDALGCPPNFVLATGVCEPCNHKNGQLDRALLTPFEIVTVIKGIPRKKGRRPTIDGFSSLASSHDENGPVLYVNGEAHSVKMPNGKVLKGLSPDNPIQDVRITRRHDGLTNISHTQQLRFDYKAVRGLFKIAFESVAYFQGLAVAQEDRFDEIRKFVKTGKGNFKALITPDPSESYESYVHGGASKPGHEMVVGMTILGVGFICDFDPEFRSGDLLIVEFKRQNQSVQVIPNWPKALWKENNNIVA